MSGDDPKGVVVVFNVVSIQSDHNVFALSEGIYPSSPREEITLLARHMFLVQAVETVVKQQMLVTSFRSKQQNAECHQTDTRLRLVSFLGERVAQKTLHGDDLLVQSRKRLPVGNGGRFQPPPYFLKLRFRQDHSEDSVLFV